MDLTIIFARLDRVKWRSVAWKMIVTFGEGVVALLAGSAITTTLDATTLNLALTGGFAAAASFLYNILRHLVSGEADPYIDPDATTDQ